MSNEHTVMDDLSTGVWFRSGVSGLYYRDQGAAGDVDMVLIDGKVFLTER